MNPFLDRLQPYPFERLRALLAGVAPSSAHAAINLSIGEPRHPTPALVTDALTSSLSGLSNYPATAGGAPLREAIAAWLQRRHELSAIDPATQVLPVNGSREALFAFAQTVIDGTRPGARVVCPNPFYQIYEGAALLAGARPWYVDQRADRDFRCDWEAVPDEVWRDTQLLYLCSPANPTGAVATLDEWRALFALSKRHDFVIASDECYSEIYADESAPPLGGLQAAERLGVADFQNLVVFSSLSKRSNVPGLRSGFVAGDAALLRRFLLYRTYHGGAMSPPVQAASVAAWRDEAHVIENRAAYRRKFEAVAPIVAGALRTGVPPAGFYLWARVPDGDDEAFVRSLYAQYNVLLLPGSYLGRASAAGSNPGQGWVRIALVESLEQCVDAAHRIRRHVTESFPTTNPR